MCGSCSVTAIDIILLTMMLLKWQDNCRFVMTTIQIVLEFKMFPATFLEHLISYRKLRMVFKIK